jgi:hypothetical protein
MLEDPHSFGGRWIMPKLRPVYVKPRVGLDRMRERRRTDSR